MAEKWKNIKDFPGYQISNKGRVKSLKRTKPIILKYDVNSNGYLRVHLSNKFTKKIFVHKLVGLHFIDNPTNEIYLDHIDRVRVNNNDSNLRWCTIKENMRNRKFKPRATR
jgi:NUMOD4 motif/HNH endonuclease